jgi:hypothetical protein
VEEGKSIPTMKMSAISPWNDYGFTPRRRARGSQKIVTIMSERRAFLLRQSCDAQAGPHNALIS